MNVQVETKLLWGRDGIELWRSRFPYEVRPSFIIISPDGSEIFHSKDHPNNGSRAIERVRQLREKYQV